MRATVHQREMLCCGKSASGTGSGKADLGNLDVESMLCMRMQLPHLYQLIPGQRVEHTQLTARTQWDHGDTEGCGLYHNHSFYQSKPI